MSYSLTPSRSIICVEFLQFMCSNCTFKHKHCTVAWFVGNRRFSHINPNVMTSMKILRKNVEKWLSHKRIKAHFLGMGTLVVMVFVQRGPVVDKVSLYLVWSITLCLSRFLTDIEEKMILCWWPSNFQTLAHPSYDECASVHKCYVVKVYVLQYVSCQEFQGCENFSGCVQRRTIINT